MVVPLLIGLLTIPHIIRGFGLEGFGFITIAWSLIGYFTVFDLGLSRALTHSLSQELISDRLKNRSQLLWTSLISMFSLGILGALTLFLLSDTLVSSLFVVSPQRQDEFRLSLQIISIAVPATIVSVGLKGVLEAYQSFSYTNLIQTLVGVSNFIAPLLVVSFSGDLIHTMIALVLIRFIGLLIYLGVCLKVSSELRIIGGFDIHCLRRLLSFGGWVTVSSIIGPVMVYFDRFIIASLLSMSVVALYTTPYEIVSRLTVVAMAIATAIFPSLSALSLSDQSKSVQMLHIGVRYVILCVLPLAIGLMVFAEKGLRVWLGSELANQTVVITKWLILGAFFNSIAFIPYSFIHAYCRPDITAKLHLLELPCYLLLLIGLLKFVGITGAAVAWTIRTAGDGILLFVMTKKIVPESSSVVKSDGLLVAIGALILLSCAVLSELMTYWYNLLLVTPIYLLFAWFYLFDTNDRSFVKELMRP